MTVQEFVLSLELNHDSYYSLKRAGNLPRADEALKIARSLNTTVEYLVTGETHGKPDTAILIAHAQALLDGLKKL